MHGTETLDTAALRREIEHHALVAYGRSWKHLSPFEKLRALIAVIRFAAFRRLDSESSAPGERMIYIISMEYLLGRLLQMTLINLGIFDDVRSALSTLGADFDELRSLEPDAGTGSGKIGALAADMLEALASCGRPAMAFGLDYEYRVQQSFINGFQFDRPENWRDQWSWPVDRDSESVFVPVYGRIQHDVRQNGEYDPRWIDYRALVGVPRDVPIVGYDSSGTATLRLFSARAADQFDIGLFNSGDYIRAAQQQISTAALSSILYPSAIVTSGVELRLLQEHFLAACAVRSIATHYRSRHESFDDFARDVHIQLNDTHGALVIAELMRLLVDEASLGWDRSWEITVATVGFTCHAVIPEALERWSVELLERVAPRHAQIILEIARRWALTDLQNSGSIVDGTDVDMGRLAVVGSHATCGIGQPHSQYLADAVCQPLSQLLPERFVTVSAGVNHRRWLLGANPSLAALITERIGERWITNASALCDLEPLAEDEAFLESIATTRYANKVALARLVRELTGQRIETDSLFVVQAKRLHEANRQLLNALHIIKRYLDIVESGLPPSVPRTFIFAGTAAPSYFMAKLIVKFIHSVGEVVNADPRSREWLRVVFLPDYRVTIAEMLVPAADVSEQIAAAGLEWSCAGALKMALNGAITVSTRDGAVMELRDCVGEENMFLYGHTAAEVASLLESGYRPSELLGANDWMRHIIDSIAAGTFSRGDRDLFRPLLASITGPRDEYIHLADLAGYAAAELLVDGAYMDRPAWLRKSVLNIARAGRLSSDGVASAYLRQIWS